MKIENMYKAWVTALADVGIAPISRDKACKLMAILYVEAGCSELFTFNERLRTDIFAAQRLLKLSGGETPEADDVYQINRYIKELEQTQIKSEAPFGCKSLRHLMSTDWAIMILKEYGIKL